MGFRAPFRAPFRSLFNATESPPWHRDVAELPPDVEGLAGELDLADDLRVGDRGEADGQDELQQEFHGGATLGLNWSVR